MMTIAHAKLFKVYVSATTMTDEAMGKTFCELNDDLH